MIAATAVTDQRTIVAFGEKMPGALQHRAIRRHALDFDEHPAAMLAPGKRLDVKDINRASGVSVGTTRSRASQARPINARCKISGTGPAPIQISFASGHKSPSARRSARPPARTACF